MSSNKMTETETSVLIIGAGPTGLMLALELSLLQIPFRIISTRKTAISFNQTRANVLHARTIELLARHDLSERLSSAGILSKEMRFYLKNNLLWKTINPGSLMGDTLFPCSISIKQPETERILEERLEEYGGKIEKGVTAKRIVTDKDVISVWVQREEAADNDLPKYDVKDELIKCKYVVGCDGMNSMVRNSAGIKFEGTSRPEECILADALVEWNYNSCIHFFVDRGFIGFLPLDEKNNFRIVCMRPQTKSYFDSALSNSSENSSRKEIKISEFEENAIAMVAGNTRIHSPTWFSSFRIHSRLASNYRVGRLFLAGDAAHVHPPVGGQGMNTGMQDAVNLGWKLARVLRSTAPESLLDTYELERRKVAKFTVNSTDLMFDLMSTKNTIKIWLRNFFWLWILPLFTNSQSSDKRIRQISQLSIRYRNSPIVKTASGWKGKLRGGDRAPDGRMIDPKGEQVTLQGLLKKSVDFLIFFSSDKNFESETIDTIIKQLKCSYIDLTVLKIFHEDVREKKHSDGYLDLEGNLHTLFQFDKPGFALIRPDGHISFIGSLNSIGELRNWMNTQKLYNNQIE